MFIFFWFVCSRYRKNGVFSSVVIILIGILVGMVMVCEMRLVSISNVVFRRVEVGSSVWWFGLVSSCSRCGIISFIKLMVFVIVMFVFIFRVIRVIIFYLMVCMFIFRCDVLFLFSISVLRVWVIKGKINVLVRISGVVFRMVG